MEKFVTPSYNPGAIINADRESYNNYWKVRRNAVETENKINEINTLKDQVDFIMKEQSEIKDLLIKLLEKN